MARVEQLLVRKGSDVIGAAPSTTVREACRKMLEANVSCLVVEQHPDVLGIFTERDVLRRVVAAGKEPARTHLAEVMSSPVTTCRPDDDTRKCAELMAEGHIRHLVVVDAGELVGVISMRDLLGR
jgi:CBS domain-containing protein